MRQAYLSQQLMAMRQSGIVMARRDGRNIYYRISDPAILDLIRYAAQVAGIAEQEIRYAGPEERVEECICPHCNPPEPPPDIKFENLITHVSSG
jgi:DNA-binding transcriptional ArsR family regulator